MMKMEGKCIHKLREITRNSQENDHFGVKSEGKGPFFFLPLLRPSLFEKEKCGLSDVRNRSLAKPDPGQTQRREQDFAKTGSFTQVH